MTKINEIFDKLDDDNDGEISTAKINMQALDSDMMEIFKPLMVELEQLNQSGTLPVITKELFMWYFAWILGVLLACSFGIINALWLEVNENLDRDADVPE